MDQKPNEEKPRISRRRFVGALGAAAAAGAFLQRGESQNAASQNYYYQDSFGNVVPAGGGAINLGIYPPPIPPALAPAGALNVDSCSNNASGTHYACNFPIYNILLIVVDQMRNPAFWLPSGQTDWVSTYASILPSITTLAKSSIIFPHYCVAATVCTPSRACLLTGLYAPQTSILQTGGFGEPLVPPPLLPYNPHWTVGDNNNAGFPTIANVLSQALPVGNSTQTMQYDCTWIGKWHLSCASGTKDGLPGENGPSDYGFGSRGNFDIPTTDIHNPYPGGVDFAVGYPSPNGDPNAGTGGDFLDTNAPTTRDVPNWARTLKYNNNNNYVNPPSISAINDAGIAYAFTNFWLPKANNTTQPAFGQQLTNNNAFFCAVSFINPHDISDFPWPFAITNNNSYFGPPTNGYGVSLGFQPPPANNSNNSTWYGTNCYNANNNTGCANEGDSVVIAGFPSLYSSGLPPGTGNNGHWNWEDLTTLVYNPGYGGKPGLQEYFKDYVAGNAGTIYPPQPYNNSNNNWTYPTAWEIFLNYYVWLQSSVDYQIGEVLGTNASSTHGLKQSNLWKNTVIIFTSDHGDYGGSHGLHAKGGALYDEVLNVPLLISYPQPRANNTQTPTYLQYICSSVDLLPFLYTLVLGNHSWRTNANDMVYYLSGREAINDAINLFMFNGNNNFTGIVQQHRISGIPLNNNSAVQPPGNNAWQNYQPFVLHTTDEFPVADNSPSHAVAFRTVDLTETNNNSAPFAGQTTYCGGKLGIYSYWETCGASQPILGLNNGQQYEFYNYSPSQGNANPQEVGNQFFNNNGGNSTRGQLYYNDFYNIGAPANTSNVQQELYYLQTYGSNSNAIQQVQAAIQTAFNNYIQYLACEGWLTGSNGAINNNCATGCSNHTNPYHGLV